ncbi:hypothetical protein Hanom_Chr09g00826741 [Helianthus anomalus]
MLQNACEPVGHRTRFHRLTNEPWARSINPNHKYKVLTTHTIPQRQSTHKKPSEVTFYGSCVMILELPQTNPIYNSQDHQLYT